MPPASKTIKLIIYSVLFVGIVGTLLLQTFFSNDIATSRFGNFKDLAQDIIRGKVINNTPYPITVYTYPFKKVIQPGKTSKQAGVYDADGILIDRPMRFDGQVYTDGVFKFCDAATMTLTVDATGTLEMHPSARAKLCQWLGDLGHYPDAKTAFEPEQ